MLICCATGGQRLAVPSWQLTRFSASFDWQGPATSMNLSEPFIHRPVATALLMAAIAFIGIAAFPFLPIASLPQIDFPTIQVTASLAGASAETMAVSVATPLERQLSQIQVSGFRRPNRHDASL